MSDPEPAQPAGSAVKNPAASWALTLGMVGLLFLVVPQVGFVIAVVPTLFAAIFGVIGVNLAFGSHGGHGKVTAILGLALGIAGLVSIPYFAGPIWVD
jgi:hypothetical protein